MILCQPADGKFFAKIGVSSIVYHRVLMLRSAIPRPIDTVLHAAVGSRESSYRLETALHTAFASKATVGEWFEFDTESEHDKALFREVTRALFREHAGFDLRWKMITPSQLAAFSSARRKSIRKEPKDPYAGPAGLRRKIRDKYKR
ncbi:GIY-YIG nuclease family protein [Dokdonella sp. MW10]|uniref:GIY-YIG nuclease family protein n=1 Tax=Dokdonella sp. MW10 TaxID=2992926 RepID=UPI003F8193A1